MYEEISTLHKLTLLTNRKTANKSNLMSLDKRNVDGRNVEILAYPRTSQYGQSQSEKKVSGW